MVDCNGVTCSRKINELLEVNSIWKHDYGELLQENKRLQDELNKINQTRTSQHATLETDGVRSRCSMQFLDCHIDKFESYQKQRQQMDVHLSYKNQFEQEKASRIRAEKREKELKEQLRDANEVIGQFQHRTTILENELKTIKHKRTLVDEEERAKNLKLMNSVAISPGIDFPDQRDSSSSKTQPLAQSKNECKKSLSTRANNNKLITKNKSRNKIFLYQ